MNGGNVVSPRVLYPRFGETVGKVSRVDWLFGLDEEDPWVKTYVVVHRLRTTSRLAVYFLLYSWRANSNVVRYRPRPFGREIDDDTGSLTGPRYFTRLTSFKSYQKGSIRHWSP